MKAKYVNVLWGAILIIAGLLFLAQTLGYLDGLSPQLWMAILTVSSLLFLAAYFLAGVQHWGWLFPACISAALAITIALAEAGVDSAAVGAPIMAGVAAPFVVAFALRPRENRWALIPAWVMSVLFVIILIAERVPGEAMGTLVLWSIAVPFLAVLVIDRRQRWALIPAFVLAAVGLIPLLSTQVSGELLGAFILFAIALPFFVVYFWTPKNWWALIPAGVLASVGLVTLLSSGGDGDDVRGAVVGGLLFLGLAATFFVLWLRRAAQPTRWAWLPAAILATLSVIVLIGGAGLTLLWPLIPLGVGLALLIFGLRPRKV